MSDFNVGVAREAITVKCGIVITCDSQTAEAVRTNPGKFLAEYMEGAGASGINITSAVIEDTEILDGTITREGINSMYKQRYE